MYEKGYNSSWKYLGLSEWQYIVSLFIYLNNTVFINVIPVL